MCAWIRINKKTYRKTEWKKKEIAVRMSMKWVVGNKNGREKNPNGKCNKIIPKHKNQTYWSEWKVWKLFSKNKNFFFGFEFYSFAFFIQNSSNIVASSQDSLSSKASQIFKRIQCCLYERERGGERVFDVGVEIGVGVGDRCSKLSMYL